MMVCSAFEKKYLFVKVFLRIQLLFAMTFYLSGCMAVRPPQELIYSSGAAVESLSSNISLAYAAHGRSISGSGYLMYLKPDKMRVVILSPFGSVLQEIYVSGELVTIVDAGNGVAFSGNFMDLPDKGDFSGWRYIHWLIDIDQPDPSRGNVVIDRINRFGQPEKATFENGLLISKSTEAAGLVRYGGYAAVQGGAFPLEIVYEAATQEKFTLLLEEPETNVPLTDTAFTPNLVKLRIYPLSRLK